MSSGTHIFTFELEEQCRRRGLPAQLQLGRRRQESGPSGIPLFFWNLWNCDLFVSLFGCFRGFMWCSNFIIIFEHPNWQSWLERGRSCEVCGKWERCPNMGKWGKPGLYSWVVLHDICSICIIYSWKRQMLNMINKQRCPNMGKPG